MSEDLSTINLDKIVLGHGKHESPEHGHCLMEVVSMFAGEPFTDVPKCVSPLLRSFGISLNDHWDDVQRQKLKQFIPLLPGTAGDGQDEARGYLALDWLIRVFTPAWLRLVPALTADADLLAGQGPITTLDEAAAAGDIVREVASRAAAVRAAAAPWATDESTAAGAATWAAAENTVWTAVGEAAWDTAGDAAWAAAGTAVRNAARDAAWTTTRDVLTPTVDHLQESVLHLFRRMIDPAAMEETA